VQSTFSVTSIRADTTKQRGEKMPGILIAFVVGALVGVLVVWYPSHLQRRASETEARDLRASLNSTKQRLQAQQVDLEHHSGQVLSRDEIIRDLNAQLEWRKVTIDQLKEVVEQKQSEIQTLKSRVEAAPTPETEIDNLKRIEGIGPRISQLLQEAGILTFAQLAATEVEHLRQIVAAAGLSALADPSTWPQQAGLAAQGDWTALQALQDELSGGRAVVG
jgi:predicted flap endonuclease-1-like 5' DNA nuclease